MIGAWLLLRAPGEPSEPVNLTSRDDVPPVAVAPPEPQAPEQSITVFLASADAARGERFFRSRCAVCHTIETGAPQGIGPNLVGVMGNRIASRPEFGNYSTALIMVPGSWDWKTTDRFLRAPRTFAPGTRMTFAGISDAQDRADVMVYMNRQGGSLLTPRGSR